MLKNLIFIFIIISSNSYSQKKLLIVDNDSFNPVAFCSVFSFLNNQTYYADNFGSLYIESIKKNDTLLLRHSGYKDSLILLNKVTDTIKLRKKVNRLKEVVIKSTTKEYRLGNFSYKKSQQLHHWTSDEFIRKIDIIEKDRTFKVKNIFLPIKFNSKYKDSCHCIVHLYRLDSNKELEDVLRESVILNYRNVKKDFMIDIDSQNIYLNDSIIFVGLDCLLSIPFEVIKKYQDYDIEKHRKFSKHSNTSPILFYFDMDSVQSNKTDGLTFMRTKSQINYKNRKTQWIPTWFTAGVTIKTY